MHEGVGKQRKALLQTYVFGLLIPLIMQWGSSCSRPSLVLVCFLVPVPLGVAKAGKLSYTAAFIAAAFMLITSWSLHDIYRSIDLWFSPQAVYLLYPMFIPLAAAFLGCHSVSAAFQLSHLNQREPPMNQTRSGSIFGAIVLAFLIALNVGLMWVAIQAVNWLQVTEQGPFFHGFWNVMSTFDPAPNWLLHFLAHPMGKFIAIFLTVIIGLGAGLATLRKHNIADGASAFVLGFVISGFPAVWVIGDVSVNYLSLELV